MTPNPRIDFIERPNAFGRRYRITSWPSSTHEPEVHVEVFTASRRRAWRHLNKHGKRRVERVDVLRYWRNPPCRNCGQHRVSHPVSPELQCARYTP